MYRITICVAVISTTLLVVSAFSAEEKNEAPRDFVFDLFRSIGENRKDQNVLFSPSSLKTALAVLRSGAAGETEKELRNLLQSEESSAKDTAKDATKEADDDEPFIPSELPKSAISRATALWMQSDSPIRPEFLDDVQKNFQAEAKRLDFAKDAADAVRTINDWVAGKTDGRIPTLYDRLSEQTRLVVTAAIVFGDRWKTAFDKTNTSPASFTLLSGEKIKMDFVSRTGSFKHKDGEDASILELPYETPGFTMLILLPNSEKSLAELERTISVEKLAQWTAELKEKELDVQLPKLSLEIETSCNETLHKLGLNLAFTREADFSRINGLHDLFLSDVKQKVFLRIDESGTEAAAVDSAVLKPKSMHGGPKSFYANRPFLFVIRNDSNVLFVGRFVEPVQASKPTETSKLKETPKPMETSDPSLSGEGGSFN